MPKIEYLDPEIANEGQRADDDSVPMEAAHVFDYAPLKTDKKYAKYFRYEYQRYPAIFYHPNGKQRIVHNHEEASELDGVKPIRGGWYCEGEWQSVEEDAHPVKPSLTEFGKILVGDSAAKIAGSTNETMAQILQQMLKSGQVPANPAMDQEYQDYLAWKRMRDAAASKPVHAEIVEPTALSDADVKAKLIDIAKEKGIPADKRWSLDRIKEELDKVA